MHVRFYTVHDGKRTIEQGFADLIAAKQRAASARGSELTTSSEPPGSVFAAACEQVARSLESDGFHYAAGSHKCSRRAGVFTNELKFSSDLYNVAGKHVLLRICGVVRSRVFKEWQKRNGLPNPGGFVASGQIGYLGSEQLELVWELADQATRQQAVEGATSAVRELALPWFALFSDLSSLRSRLIEGTVPMLDITASLNFLMCFATREDAATAGRAFLTRRPDLISTYRQEFRKLRDRAPLRVHGQGYAKELAIVSHFFDLGELACE